jgi:hypothetical protein
MRKKKETYGTPIHSKKHATQKNHKSKSQHSILQKHEQKLEEFQNKVDRLRVIKDKINSVQKQIDKLKKENSIKMLNNNFDYASLDNSNVLLYKYNQKIENLQKEYNLIESGEDEQNYLLESSQIMFQYMSLENQEEELLHMNNLTDEYSCKLNDINTKKNDLTDQYLSKFQPDYYDQMKHINFRSLKCEECNINYDVVGGYLVCPECGICIPTVEQANELSYKEMQDYDYRPQFTYDKMTHLEDWLRRFQAKENRSIPQEVLDKVILEAKKERVKDLNLLTEDKIKRYLKKLDLNDYYDNVIGIINRINGRPPFTLTPEIEDKIKSMFQQIQDPYEKFKPSNRKNFLSYSYTLHKFFQILGLHEFAKYFPLLKSTDKLRQQDDIFKKIVGYMSEKDPHTKWVFYPSI